MSDLGRIGAFHSVNSDSARPERLSVCISVFIEMTL